MPFLIRNTTTIFCICCRKSYLNKAETEVVETEVLAKNEEFSYDEEDINEMNEMYSSMNKSEKEAHYSAIKSTLFGDEDLNKSEEINIEVENEENTLLKSEIETVKGNLEVSNKENADLKKSIETLTEIVSKIVKKAPSRKAVTQLGNIQVMKKTEELVGDKKDLEFAKLSKSEINKILTSKIRSGEIKKTEDKNNINKFCYGEINLDKIKYLL